MVYLNSHACADGDVDLLVIIKRLESSNERTGTRSVGLGR